MTRLRAFCAAVFTVSVVLMGEAAAQGTPGSVEQLYAELAKLPPAERQKRIEEGARKEGVLNLIHTIRGALSRNHIALFQKAYPFVRVENTDIGSQDATEQLVAEETAGRHLTDVISVAIPDLTEVLKRNLAARYPTPAAAAILPKYKDFMDPEDRFTPWYWSEHGISYNSNLVPPDKAPRDWKDLCNPFFQDSVSYDPAEARFLAGLYAIFGEKGTEDLLKCIGENKPIIQRGHSQRVELMLAGDHMVQGDNYLYAGLEMKRKNPKAPFQMMLSAPIIAFGGAAVINRNAPHPYAAALFTDWTLSEESQRYIAGVLRGPTAVPHPYLPDDVKLAISDDIPSDIMERLFGYWAKYIARTQ